MLRGTSPHARLAADRRIRLIRQSNQGIVASMNRVLGLVGKRLFVARMDADDICCPSLRAATGAFLTGRRRSARSVQYVEIDNGGRRRSGHFRQPVGCDDVRAELELRPAVANPTVMFRTDALRKAGALPSGVRLFAEITTSRCSSEIADIDNLPDTLLLYRRSPEQMSVANNAQQTEQAAWCPPRRIWCARRPPILPRYGAVAAAADLDALLKKSVHRTDGGDRYHRRAPLCCRQHGRQRVRRLLQAAGERRAAGGRDATVVRCLVNRRVDRAFRLASSLVAGAFARRASG